MKNIFMAALLIVSTTASANSVVANGTRFIYPGNEREISIQLTNTSTHPSLVQSWLDDGNPDMSPDDISTPFTITPPVTKINGKSGQTLRIRNIDKESVAKDHETLWWLNVLEIPPSVSSTDKKDKNALLMAIRSRFKFIYRPTGLGDVTAAPKELSFIPGGKKVTISNPTPFYITITKITKGNQRALNANTVMIKPKDTVTVPLTSPVSHGDRISITILNDFGSDAEYNLTAK